MQMCLLSSSKPLCECSRILYTDLLFFLQKQANYPGKDTRQELLLQMCGFPKNQLTLWKYPEMLKITKLNGHASRVLFMAQSPDGCMVASAGANEALRIWKVFGSPDKCAPKKDSGLYPFPSINRISFVLYAWMLQFLHLIFLSSIGSKKNALGSPNHRKFISSSVDLDMGISWIEGECLMEDGHQLLIR
uniref:Uncharacterized protein n=1 Tax=Nelumbo nucifera TaxID=4432 RepID=A0A822Y0I2_NELNU|nr:TPA_asm: hypothetical protein HUJ06_026220 [Nelumbo nucifera]